MRVRSISGRGRTLVIASFWILPFLALGAGRADADQVYRWTDEKGKVHFSNVAPPGQEEKTEESAPAAPEPLTSEPEGPSGSVVEPRESADSEKKEPAKEKPGRFSDLSDDSFSTRVSRQRATLKKDLAQAKRHVRDLDEQIAAVREERSQATSGAILSLQGVTAPGNVDSERELALKKDKEDTEKRIQEIRKEYDELREEAVKRYGGVPGWWLSIE